MQEHCLMLLPSNKMTKLQLKITPELHDYIVANSLCEPPIVRALRDETARMLMSAMQTPPEETQFITQLLTLTGAKRMLEVGVFTGYTTLWAALTMPHDAEIVACDVDDEWPSVGRRFWQQAGIDHKIDLRIAPALQTLEQMLDSDYANYFDFMYIDADKENYMNYYELGIRLVRRGGLIAIDNVLWGGSVVDVQNQGRDAQAIRALNSFVCHDHRVSSTILPLGDGLTLAIRK